MNKIPMIDFDTLLRTKPDSYWLKKELQSMDINEIEELKTNVDVECIALSLFENKSTNDKKDLFFLKKSSDIIEGIVFKKKQKDQEKKNKQEIRAKKTIENIPGNGFKIFDEAMRKDNEGDGKCNKYKYYRACLVYEICQKHLGKNSTTLWKPFEEHNKEENYESTFCNAFSDNDKKFDNVKSYCDRLLSINILIP